MSENKIFDKLSFNEKLGIIKEEHGLLEDVMESDPDQVLELAEFQLVYIPWLLKAVNILKKHNEVLLKKLQKRNQSIREY